MDAKVIQDPIHGSIAIEDWIIRIIDTPQFQRLRRIKQLGFGNLVYPGANHTRFEHSIGVMHIAKLLTSKMSIDDQIKKEIIAAALIHDIGHPPFSHTTEKLVERHLGLAHEDVHNTLKGSEIGEILEEEGLRFRRVVRHVRGQSNIDIVSGDIDADRMDYLVRDSYYTGVAYGVFDLMRLINKMYFEEYRLVIDAGGLRAAESLLVSRFMMYPTVYFHHVCRIAEKMYEKALEKCVVEELVDAEEILRMDDYDVIAFLRKQKGYPAEMMAKIDSRKLMKRAVYVGLHRIGIDIFKVNPKKAEEEIAEDAGVESEYIFVDIPSLEDDREFKATVNLDGEIMKLEDASSLVRVLKDAQRETWKMGVYTLKEYQSKVAKVAADYFDIERIRKQKKLDEVLPIW
jgi:hypothetical protein